MASEKLVMEAVMEFDSGLEIESVSDISGENRETYHVKLSSGRNLICCFNKDKPEWFKKERKLIEMVNERTSFPTQKILYSDLSKEKLPRMFHIAEKIEGSKSEEAYEKLSLEDKEKVVLQVGRYLAEIHKNVAFDDFGRLRYRKCSLEVQKYRWKDLVREMAEGYIEEMEGTRFEDMQEDLRNYVLKNLDILNDSNPVLVHYDVAADNVIRENSDLKAIIDWERAFVGQAEWDLAYSEVRFILQFLDSEKDIEMLRKAFFESYQEVRELNQGWRTRKEFFGMIQLFHGMKYFENWTDRKNYTEQQKEEEEEWHRRHLRENNRKLEY